MCYNSNFYFKETHSEEIFSLLDLILSKNPPIFDESANFIQISQQEYYDCQQKIEPCLAETANI